MENKKSFGAYICAQRKALGMTQREFADKLFLTESAVSKWERGAGFPDVSLLEPLADALDLRVLDLLRGRNRSRQSRS